MTIGLNTIEELQKFILQGYGKNLPSEVDKLFIELAEIYIKLKSEGREVIRGAIKNDMRLLIIGFSDRLSIMAERTRDKHKLFLALIAHSIEDFQYDPRENTFRLVLINHVANKLNVSMKDIVSKAIELSSSNGIKHLTSYLNRPKELNTLKVMGIQEVFTDEGTDYKYLQ